MFAVACKELVVSSGDTVVVPSVGSTLVVVVVSVGAAERKHGKAVGSPNVIKKNVFTSLNQGRVVQSPISINPGLTLNETYGVNPGLALIRL